MTKVEHLDINYKTEELFEDFRQNFGNKDLYMVNELHGEMIDASSESPFYGIYVGEKLAHVWHFIEKAKLKRHFSEL